MSDKILIKTFEEHIKGYGFLSDLHGETHHGIPLEEAEKYETIWEEFVEDLELEPYQVDTLELPKIRIPRGTLYIYGKLKQPIINDAIAEAIGWKKEYNQHSIHHRTVPYWDQNGAYMSAVWTFDPIGDMHEAMDALQHLIDSEQITNTEVCQLICEFIINRKKQSCTN